MNTVTPVEPPSPTESICGDDPLEDPEATIVSLLYHSPQYYIYLPIISLIVLYDYIIPVKFTILILYTILCYYIKQP